MVLLRYANYPVPLLHYFFVKDLEVVSGRAINPFKVCSTEGVRTFSLFYLSKEGYKKTNQNPSDLWYFYNELVLLSICVFCGKTVFFLQNGIVFLLWFVIIFVPMKLNYIYCHLWGFCELWSGFRLFVWILWSNHSFESIYFNGFLWQFEYEMYEKEELL